MANITLKELEHLALLARINFPKEELVSLKKDLSGILSYVEKLQEVPPSSGELRTLLSGSESQARDDEAEETLTSADEVLESVPERKGRWVKAPKIRR